MQQEDHSRTFILLTPFGARERTYRKIIRPYIEAGLVEIITYDFSFTPETAREFFKYCAKRREIDDLVDSICIGHCKVIILSGNKAVGRAQKLFRSHLKKSRKVWPECAYVPSSQKEFKRGAKILSKILI